MIAEREREKAFRTAANALYLNRMHFTVLLRSEPQGSRYIISDEDQADRRGYSPFHERLSIMGLIDDRLEPPFQELESLSKRNDRMKNLIQSDADIAKIAFRDVPFSDGEKLLLKEALGRSLSWSEWATPICRWTPPGEIIATAREIVFGFFKRLENEEPVNPHPKRGAEILAAIEKRHVEDLLRAALGEGEVPITAGIIRRAKEAEAQTAKILSTHWLGGFLPRTATSTGGPRPDKYIEVEGRDASPSWKIEAAGCKAWTARQPNTFFIQQTVTLMVVERLSAKASAEKVVDENGHSSKGKYHKSGTVVGQEYNNAVENLSRAARKIFKVLEERRVLPT